MGDRVGHPGQVDLVDVERPANPVEQRDRQLTAQVLAELFEAFRQALAIVSDDQAHRAKRILDLFSDHSTEPLASAAGMKGAFGTYPGPPLSDREGGA